MHNLALLIDNHIKLRIGWFSKQKGFGFMVTYLGLEGMEKMVNIILAGINEVDKL